MASLGETSSVFWDLSPSSIGQRKDDQVVIDGTIHVSRHKAQLLEVFEGFWVCIQLNFNRGYVDCLFSCHS